MGFFFEMLDQVRHKSALAVSESSYIQASKLRLYKLEVLANKEGVDQTL